jgi:hypothetical protein
MDSNGNEISEKSMIGKTISAFEYHENEYKSESEKYGKPGVYVQKLYEDEKGTIYGKCTLSGLWTAIISKVDGSAAAIKIIYGVKMPVESSKKSSMIFGSVAKAAIPSPLCDISAHSIRDYVGSDALEDSKHILGSVRSLN